MELFYTGNVKEEGEHDYIRSGRGANVIRVAENVMIPEVFCNIGRRIRFIGSLPVKLRQKNRSVICGNAGVHFRLAIKQC